MKHLSKALATFAALFAATAAWAHTGGAPHDHLGFTDGLLHPLTGLDHLAAMLAVGIWSALAVRPVWLAPASFVAMLAAGALAGFAGMAVPGVEPLIAASLLVVGLLVATRTGLPAVAAMALAGGFAFFHGAAHGVELAGGGQMAALAGMLLATAALHLAGIGLGRLIALDRGRERVLSALSGGAVALLGLGLLARMAA